MPGFVKIDGDIFGSSIMEEKPVTRLVWFFFLAAADRYGRVDQTHQSLARLYNLPLADVEEAIRDLEQPDDISRSPAEDGRRIVRLDEDRTWGWQIVNYQLYRDSRNADERRAYKTAHQATRRAAERSTEDEEGDCPQVSTAVHTSPRVDKVDRRGPMQKQKAEAEGRSREERRAPSELVDEGDSIVPTPRQAEHQKSIRIALQGHQLEMEWRVKRTWADHIGMRELHWKDHEHRAQAPGRAPTLTPARRKAIVAALMRHDGEILSPDSREEWIETSPVRAAGVGIFFDPWMTADKEGNRAGEGGVRYLNPDYCWKVCRDGTDNVGRFADIYFARKARKEKDAQDPVLHVPGKS